MSIDAEPDMLASNGNTHSVAAVTRIYITPGKFDRKRGQRYNAHLGSPDGERIVTNALDVEYAACRALKARGVSGRLETWHPGSARPAMVIADITEAAKWTIREDEWHGPSRVKYRPWSESKLSRRRRKRRSAGVVADRVAL